MRIMRWRWKRDLLLEVQAPLMMRMGEMKNSGRSITAALEFDDALLVELNTLLTQHAATLRHLVITLFTKSSLIPSQLQVRLAAFFRDGGEQDLIDTWSLRKNIRKWLDQSATARVSLLCHKELVRLSKLRSTQLPYKQIQLKDKQIQLKDLAEFTGVLMGALVSLMGEKAGDGGAVLDESMWRVL